MVTSTNAKIEEQLTALRNEVRQLVARIREENRAMDRATSTAEATRHKRKAQDLRHQAKLKIARMERLVRRLR